jgi:hypothetical protein
LLFRLSGEQKARGVNDILIAVVDGLKGFPEAITSVYPQTLVQTCIVHLIRNSLALVSWKDRKAILPSIKAIYRAESADGRAAGHSSVPATDLAAAARRGGQGWPRLRPPHGLALTGPSTAARWRGTGLRSWRG